MPDEHRANNNATEAYTTAQIRTILQNFDVLSKADKRFFRGAYLCFIVFFVFNLFLLLVSYLPYSLAKAFNRSTLFVTFFELLFIVGIFLIIWTFKIWRKQLPQTLRDVFENNRIYASTADDRGSLYLNFLKQYRDDLCSPKKYLLRTFLLIIVIIHFLYEFHFKTDLISHLSLYNMYLLFIVVIQGIFVYCLGIVFRSLSTSGQHFREMSRTFEFRIEPIHPDHCGGFNRLGKLYFSAGYPVVIGSAFYIGWMSTAIYFTLTGVSLIDVTTIGIILFVTLLALRVAIVASFLPLWSIHAKMSRERETYEQCYTVNIMPLREKIPELLNDNQLEEAKTMKEKKDLMEALYIPYPLWPFNVRAQFLTATFSAGGSLLLGVLTTLVKGLAQTILHLPPTK